MIYRHLIVATPRGCYVQKVHDKKTGEVTELKVYLYTEHFRNRANGNMPSHKSKAIGSCVSTADTSKMYPNDNYYTLVDTNIPESVLEVRREAEARRAARQPKNRVEGARTNQANVSNPMQAVLFEGEQVVQGTALLLGLLADRIGITDALKVALQGNSQLLWAIMAIAAMFCEGQNALMHLPDFISRNFAGALNMDDRRASEVFSAIDRGIKKRFFVEWIKKHNQKEGTVFYDVSSISTYAQDIEIAEYGYNRDHENLPQVNIGLLVDQKSRLPLYFCLYNGSLNDATQLPYVLQDLKEMGLSIGLIFTMDSGFGDSKRIHFLHSLGFKLLVGISLSRTKSLYELVDIAINNNSHISIDNMLPDFENTFGLKQEYTYNGVKGVLMFFFDKNRAALDSTKVCHAYRNLNDKINELEEKYRDKPCKLPAKEIFKFKKFFSVTEDSSSSYGWKISHDDEKFRLWYNRCGWFCLFTTDISLTLNEALLNYRDKECIECTFDTGKNTMGARRLRTHNDYTAEGKMFVQFISLALFNCMYSALASLKKTDPKHFGKFTMKQLVQSFANLQFIYGKDKKIRLLKAPTALHQKLLDALGISVEQFKVDAQAELPSS